MKRMYGFGLITGFAVATLFFLCQTLLDASVAQRKDTKPSQFQVVDTYEGCDVVRWTQNNLADYKYFLHCDR